MQPRSWRSASLALALLVAAGCGRPTTHFSEPNARAHVQMLAGTIGSRAVGTPANARARAYLIDQLRLFGFEVRIQETDAQRPESRRTARVANIIATRRGARPEAIALVAHYDSSPDAPGATDDGLGVAVCVEAGRVLAAREAPQYSLLIVLTDGEEAGLMGAAAVAQDPEITRHVAAYVNLESIGSDGTAVLFETGPGNRWLVGEWARAAAHPRGTSWGSDVYRWLPNDTDFSVLRTLGVPGLNFAPIRDSYAYHTARDTPERLSAAAIRDTGENIVAVVEALDRADATRRSAEQAVFFDVGERQAFSYGPRTALALAIAALLLAALAGFRALRMALRLGGLSQLVFAALWSLVGVALLLAAMAGAAWALRATRESYHPWYAYPGRFFLYLFSVGISVAWAVYRLLARLPLRWRGAAHPALVWCLTLPIWAALTIVAHRLAPGAGYLWTLPLLTAGLLLSVTPFTSRMLLQAVSVVVLGVTGALWIRDSLDLMEFAVAVFGRLPIVTPIIVYPALAFLLLVMVGPPFVAACSGKGRNPRLVRSLLAGLLLLVVSGSAISSYRAPAYTYDQPLRREVRYLHDGTTGEAVWEVAGNEPGLDVLPPALDFGWRQVADAPQTTVRQPRLPGPFVFRARASADTVPPATVSTHLATHGEDLEIEAVVQPLEPGLTVSFALPAGVVPLRANLPGGTSGATGGRWIATYVAPAPDGVAFRATLRPDAAASLGAFSVLIDVAGVPGGVGWQRLPAWLPQERSVWHATSRFIVPAAPLPVVEPVPAPAPPSPVLR